MFYTESSIDRVREADLQQVIGKYVELKKSGSTLKGLSPFQSESTPSFMVSPSKNIWKCFASGKGGNDAIGFIMEHEKVGFIEAVKIVADICGIALEAEEQNEAKQKLYEQKTKILALNANVASEYAQQFTKLPADHWAKKHIESLGYTQDEIIMFQIGYAPGNLVSNAVVKNAKLEPALAAGLVTTRSGTSYDFFYDRIIFPIHNHKNEVIGFGGRCSRDKQKETAKYLNSKESEVFNKSTSLYGMRQARHSIVKSAEAILVEGYTDVISMHQAGATNTIATCGTALTEHHAKKLKYIANHLIIFRDGDPAGIKATLRDIDILLRTGKKISVLIAEEGEDPDTIARKVDDIGAYIVDNCKDAIEWKSEHLLANIDDSPTEKAMALAQVVESLGVIENEIIRKEYFRTVSKIFSHSIRDIAQEVKRYLNKKADERISRNRREGIDETDYLGLPKDASIDEYKEKGFVTIGNCFWCRCKEGWMKASNFRLTPLFHVEGDRETVRLFDMVNDNGDKALVELESSLLLNLTQNQNRLFDYGVYQWAHELSQNSFKLIMSQLLRRFIKVKPFSYFGWQSKGFWAYSNGVFAENEFHPVNDYGIVSVEGLEQIESEYYNNTKHWYSPAFNITNRYKEDDLDMYQNDRSFVFVKAPIRFNEWMKQMSLVYGKRGNVAVAFCVATLFKDIIMSRYSFFPLLFCAGEKESGKSAFSSSIGSFFTLQQQAFQIDSSSKVGFFRRLQRGRNTATVMEEFNDKIDNEKFQAIKGAWDGRGREIGMMSNDSRTKVSEVRCSLVIAGQYLSSRDDNSITSRSIIETFQKPTEQIPESQVVEYNRLKEWEEKGITSLLLEVVKHRPLMEARLHQDYNKNARKFKAELKQYEYQERMLQNYNAIYTPVAILYEYFDFPFRLEEFFLQCKNGIIDNSDLLIESEGLSEFWNVIGKLAERGMIQASNHYMVDKPIEEKLVTKRGMPDEVWANPNRNRVLYLRVNSVHQDYALAVSKRDDVDVIGEATLRTYFKSKRYFIGTMRSKRFPDGPNTSCYLFDYDMMSENGILTLPGLAKDADDDNPMIPDGEKGQDLDPELFND